MPYPMPYPVDETAVARAVAALARGEAIGLPTETVYGLAADATRADAVRRIFALKGRPADHPLIVHLAAADALDAWAADVPPAARALADSFWPGPLTLILKRAAGVLDLVTGGQETVGLRVPSHPVAQAVLGAFGGALAAPSANRYGHVSPTTAAHVRAEFGDAVPVVLDGGECEVGIESTIVDVSRGTPRILRPGRISADEVAAVLHAPLASGPATGAIPRVSGSLASHYAPRTPATLLAPGALTAALAEARARGERVGVIGCGALPSGVDGLALADDPRGYAHDLYAALRTLDAGAIDRIVIVAPPSTAAWLAINDRLTRATTARTGEDAP